MKHKIVFFDMDGTLYHDGRDLIQDSTLAALSRLREAGYLIGAVSSRPLNQMQPILDRVSFDYYVLMNGGYILDSNFELVDASPISDQDASELVELAGANGLGLMFHFGDASYIYNEFYPMYNYSRYQGTLDSLFYDQTQSFHRRHAPKGSVILTRDASIIEDFMKTRPQLSFDLSGMSSNGLSYDIFSSSSSRTSGIESILAREGLSWLDVIAFGDSIRDIAMLEKADLGIAMGSARDEVKSAANQVTTSVLNNGIFNAIKAILAEEGF